MTKKEAAKLTDEMTKLTLTVGGMRKMKRVPGAVFIIDPHRERIAVTEANKLEVPVVATGDTNVDPDEIDHIIPANDDAIRSIRLLCHADRGRLHRGPAGARRRAPSSPSRRSRWPPSPSTTRSASDELVAALAGGAALTFEPDADDEDLLPGARPLPAATDGAPAPAEATRRRSPRSSPARPPRRKSRRPPADRAALARDLDSPRGRSPGRPTNTTGERTDMADISAAAVKELRERTGAGFMDCKNALVEADGDVEKAVGLLRERGLAAAAKKAEPRRPRRASSRATSTPAAASAC